MLINKIKLSNFRNYESQEIIFGKDINVFYGDNAQGKTNIIESIFMAAFGKSFRTNKDKEIIQNGKDYTKLELYFEDSNRENKIELRISNSNGKEVYVNGVKINRLSELLGKINVVLFTPDDISILKDGPSVRRRFLDMLIGQIRQNYIYNLNQYLRILEERNNYLKDNKLTEGLLQIYDEKLTEYAEIVYNYRRDYINKIKNYINDVHSKITDNNENLRIEYKSDFENKEQFINLLKKSRNNDLFKGYTTKGIHRDDFAMFVNDKEMSIYGSQGQNRTAVLSLKLCELNIIRDEIGESPVLLLDDFMSELDEKRRLNFLKNIDKIQVVITCTDIMENKKYTIYKVSNGNIAQN